MGWNTAEGFDGEAKASTMRVETASRAEKDIYIEREKERKTEREGERERERRRKAEDLTAKEEPRETGSCQREKECG